MSEEPVARGPRQAQAGGEGAGRAAAAPPTARRERGTRQGHPEGRGRVTAPAASLPSSLDTFRGSLQSPTLIASAAPNAAEQ